MRLSFSLSVMDLVLAAWCDSAAASCARASARLFLIWGIITASLALRVAISLPKSGGGRGEAG